MATERSRPYAGANFLVDLGTGDTETVRAGFAEVVMPAGLIDVVEYRAGNSKTPEPLQLAGVTRYRNVVLKRGVIGSLDLYEWWDQARNGDPDVRRVVTISLLSEDRSEVAMTWKLEGAWPVAYSTSDLSGTESGVAMEILELAYERMTVE